MRVDVVMDEAATRCSGTLQLSNCNAGFVARRRLSSKPYTAADGPSPSFAQTRPYRRHGRAPRRRRDPFALAASARAVPAVPDRAARALGRTGAGADVSRAARWELVAHAVLRRRPAKGTAHRRGA